MASRILISGAGIAGLVAAYWLSKRGLQVTVVEQSERLRLGGQNIDISDAAVDVINQMELGEKVRSLTTNEKGLQFVSSDNTPIASFPVGAKGSLTKEIEILRGDLIQTLADSCSDSVNFRFNTTIHALVQNEDHVKVSFEDGEESVYRFVLVAEGMNSPTRKLVFGEEPTKRFLGCWSSYFTIPRTESDNDWWRWYTSPTGIIAFLRPDNQGTIRASVNFLSDEGSPPRMSLEEKKIYLRKKMEGAGWECSRIAEQLLEVQDLFLGPLHQITAENWSQGRCVLIGDAAHCPTPYTGMGTSLAIVGSYILANNLALETDFKQAFTHYQEIFRPFAEKNQQLPPGVPHLAYARSKIKVKLIHAGAAIAASRPVQWLFSRFGESDGPKKNTFTLPRYP